MSDSSRLSAGANQSIKSLADCEELAAFAGDGACRIVLQSVCRRDIAGEKTTVWDIHRLTGLALHEAFAALRTLEYGKIIDILDDPSDPFGATIRLRDDGLQALEGQSPA